MIKKDRNFFYKFENGFLPYLVSSFIIFFVAFFCYLFQPYISYHSVSLILLFTVSILPLLFSPGPVLLSAAFSALIWNFLFIPPLFTFYIAKLEDLLTYAMYFIIAITTGVLTSRIHKQERDARLREKRTLALFSMTKELSGAVSLEQVVSIAIKNLKDFFNIDVIILLTDDHGKLSNKAFSSNSYQLSVKEFNIANWTFSNQKQAGRFTSTLTESEFKYYPLSTPRLDSGVIGLIDTYQFSNEMEIVFQTFIYQVASAIEREILNEKAKKSMLLSESERLYETLFNSISHELKTPLATTMAATENLLDINILKNIEMSTQLVEEIHIANNRLNILVANLLDMSRLESGMLKLNQNWQDLTDLISQVLKRLKKELSGHIIKLEIEDDLPLIKIDFTLLEQALLNILINASVYTPEGSEIEILAVKSEESIKLAISDNGPGLPVESLNQIFDKFYRGDSKRTGGSGLGLSIVKGFIDAHKGTITVKNRDTGGLTFLITLKINE
jgi:two-component system sensor histidine kinase KdpD